MATYNGVRFLRPQMASILSELEPGDEVIVVDDCSSDDTVAMLESFGDPRIRIQRNAANVGPQATFDRSIGLAANDIIMMADQDDVWIPGRVAAMVRTLEETGAALVSSNSEYIDADGAAVTFPMPPLRAEDSRRYLLNIVRVFTGRAAYCGCSMAFSRSLRRVVLPIPRYVESHDLWIATAANLTRANAHLEMRTLQRRIHGGNVSVIQRGLTRKVWARAKFGLALLHLAMRIVSTPSRDRR
jgi:glycosyltransferase involved in cell wall biosynthesis